MLELINTKQKTSYFGSLIVFLWLILTPLNAHPSPSQYINTIDDNKPIVWRPTFQSWLTPSNIFDNENLLKEHIIKLNSQKNVSTKDQPSHGFSHDALVTKLDIQAPNSATNTHYVIYVNYPLLDHIKLLGFNSQGHLIQLHHTGDSFDFSSRTIPHRAFAFPITITPGDTRTYYLTAKSRDTLELPINIFTKSAFVEHMQKEQYILGAYFGGVIMMACFMLTLFINFKDRTLIMMSIYLICLAGVVGSVTGVTSQTIITDSPELAKNIRIIFLAISMMCTMIFGIDYLESKTNMPKLHWAFIGTSIGCAILPLLIFIVPFFYLIQITLIFCIIVASIVITACIIMLKKRYTPAIYYSIAWCWFIFGTIANVGRAFGVFPTNSWTEYGFQWGSMVSVVCLALGIASKFNSERENRLRIEKIAFDEKQNRLRDKIVIQEEQLKSRNAEADAKAKGEFLANMSHEIRTPMNGVIGLTQILKETSLTEDQKGLISTIETSGKTLLGVLNDILDYSKIESGKFDVEEIPVKPKEIVKNTTELFRKRAKEKKIDINYQVDKNVPPLICSDPTRLSQILLNLTSNALKFTNEGQIVVRVVNEGDQHLRFEVSDTGIGLSKSQQNKLFQSFSQADSSTTRKYGGTGLGLYISRRLSELMGGEIGVESVENKGSTFWFTIKLNEIVHDPALDTNASNITLNEKISDTDFSMLNLLIAEDNKINQMVIKGLLKKTGIKPVIVENGSECVSTISNPENSFNCILMDCEMPEMDGYEATIRIRQNNNLAQPIIIGLSANALKEQEIKALNAGMNEYLRKPIDLDQLFSKLVLAKNKLK